MVSSNLAPIALLGLGGALWWNSEQSKKKAKAKTPSAPVDTPSTPGSGDSPLSPFASGSNCTQTADTAVLEQWLETTATTAFLEVMGTMGEATIENRAQVWDIVDAVWARATPPCLDTTSDAYAQAYKSAWCLVVTLLSVQARIDADTFDVLRSCDDAAFDPHRARPSRPVPSSEGEQDGEVPVEPTPPDPSRPPIPEPDPLLDPLEPVEPPFPVPPGPLGSEEPPFPLPPLPDPATDDSPWRNIASPTSREDIQETSLLRLVAAGEREGQTRARASTVVLALDPEWEHAEQAIAGLEHYADAHHELMFYVISFWDTQQHFGLPELLGGLKYILSSANAEGLAARDPFIGNNTDLPIHPSQWDAVIGHARSGAPGLVGRSSSTPRVWSAKAQPGRSLGATLLGLGPQSKMLPSKPPKQTPKRKAAARALPSVSSMPIPYHRFAAARLHRRLGT